MAWFVRRPLTWLFIATTACLDAIALATDNESPFANALALGQLFIAAGWLVLGRRHRLARAAVFVAAIGLLTFPDFIIPRVRGGFYADLVWPHVLGMLIAMGAATVAGTFWWSVMPRLTSRGARPKFRRSDWQFPVAELFGWTIIVAVASVGLRQADFSQIVDPKNVSLSLALTFLAGAVMALPLIDYGRREYSFSAWAKVSAAGLIGGAALLLTTQLPSEARPVAAGALAYAACWAIVMRLDRRAEATDSIAKED